MFAHIVKKYIRLVNERMADLSSSLVFLAVNLACIIIYRRRNAINCISQYFYTDTFYITDEENIRDSLNIERLFPV